MKCSQCDLDMAESWIQKARQLIEALENPGKGLSAVQNGEFWRACGMLAIRKGEWQVAATHLRKSAGIFQRLRSRLYQGRVTMQMGALAQAQGDFRAALMQYREAALLFQSVGARLESLRADQTYQGCLSES